MIQLLLLLFALYARDTQTKTKQTKHKSNGVCLQGVWQFKQEGFENCDGVTVNFENTDCQLDHNRQSSLGPEGLHEASL